MEPQLSTEEKVWTEAELMSLPDVGKKYELVEGDLIVTPAAGLQHEVIGGVLIEELRRAAKRGRPGYVAGSSLGCWMRNGNLRCPDVSFISMDRFNELEQDADGFLKGAPDLAVEILPPSNTVKEMKDKAAEYFTSGSRLVWIVNPYDEAVVVLRADGSEKVLT
ncbi:MAG: Uma2 family endonuclease, partial [Pseudomonadota bacterium]